MENSANLDWQAISDRSPIVQAAKADELARQAIRDDSPFVIALIADAVRKDSKLYS